MAWGEVGGERKMAVKMASKKARAFYRVSVKVSVSGLRKGQSRADSSSKHNNMEFGTMTNKNPDK